MFHEIMQHPIMLGVGGYWLFSAIVGGMPDPVLTSSAGYKWAYNSLHLLAGNLSTAFANRFPNLAMPAGSAMEHKETTVVVTPQ